MDFFSPEFYSELRLLARALMRGERRNHTLSATDLFHEAYCRVHPCLLQGVEKLQDVRALFAITMRRVLIDHARKRARRNGILPRSPDNVENSSDPMSKNRDPYELERIDKLEEALKNLAKTKPVHAKIVELKYFGGQSIEACADILGLSTASIQRYWDIAKAMVAGEIRRMERDQG